MYWRVREGLHGLIGKLRPPGTALIVEDVCVSPARIAEGARDLQALLGEHGYLTGVAGHASAGNLHFMLTPDFSKPEDLANYDAFIEKLIALIVDRYDGSLKAEHGTGINMAPFVAREWGAKATALMARVKRLADPDGVLGPGVVLSDDPGVHLRNLMTTPPIEEVATACVECGFCEPVCPSRDLTTTPRQRIVLRREMARQAHGLAGPATACTGVRVRRARDVRRRRQLRARLPARHRHRQARQGPARRATHRAFGEGRAAPSPALGDGRAHRTCRPAQRRRRSARSHGGRHRHPRSAKRRLERARSRVARKTCRARRPPSYRRRHARVRRGSTCRHASTASSVGCERPQGRRPQSARGDGRRLRTCRFSAVDSRRRRRALLRDALDFEGLRGGCAANGKPHRGGALALERQRALAGRSATRAHAPSASPPSRSGFSARSTPNATASSRSSTRSPGHSSG